VRGNPGWSRPNWSQPLWGYHAWWHNAWLGRSVKLSILRRLRIATSTKPVTPCCAWVVEIQQGLFESREWNGDRPAEHSALIAVLQLRKHFNLTWCNLLHHSYQLLLLLGFMPSLTRYGFRYWSCCESKSCACANCANAWEPLNPNSRSTWKPSRKLIWFAHARKNVGFTTALISLSLLFSNSTWQSIDVSAPSYLLVLAKTALNPSTFLNVARLFLASVHKVLLDKSILFEMINVER